MNIFDYGISIEWTRFILYVCRNFTEFLMSEKLPCAFLAIKYPKIDANAMC